MIYPYRSTPSNTLEFMSLAYQERDTVRYALAFDDAYEGISTDLTEPDPNKQVSTFRKADEVAHIGALRRDASVLGLRFTMGLPGAWVRLPSDEIDHRDWAVIPINEPNLFIDIQSGDDLVIADLTTFDFKFAPYLDSSSPTDTLWRIVKWIEVLPLGP